MPSRRLAPLLAVLLAVLALPAHAAASRTQESTFQDDPLLLSTDPDVQLRALSRIAALGADRIRVSLFWSYVAPDNTAKTKPAGFDGGDPAAYGNGWERYDRLLRNAERLGLRVNLNVTAPAPRWAVQDAGARQDIQDVWKPDPAEFGKFVLAAARRYDGTTPGLPRVSYWTIWNEPNQGAWRAPQYVDVGGEPVEQSPRMYRELVDAAVGALGLAGHTPATDTILIGETAPKGRKDRTASAPVPPRRFLLRLFCLDDNAQFLRGAAAEAQGCPTGADPGAELRATHPPLFSISGWAHHPYELTFAPDRRPQDPESFTIANIRDLERLLGRVFARVGVPIPGGAKRFPLYLTEFGYQTDPPDPLGVTYAQQAAYLNQAEYLTARDPAVRTLAQFLLVDDRPQDAFQSGLLTLDGQKKPAFNAYRLPVWVARPAVRAGGALRVWGMARGGRNGTAQRVAIQLRAGSKGAWRTARTVTTDEARGYLDATVRPRRSGSLRLSWQDPVTKRTVRSRTVKVTVRRGR